MTADKATLSALAEDNIRLSQSYDVDAIRAAWARGDYGTLTDYDSGSDIRPATAAEALASYESGVTGAIDLDGRTVYVAP
jgi:hypothetical protein